MLACGGARRKVTPVETVRVVTPGEAVLGLLPEGAQVIVEIDLARLKANGVVGQVVSDGLAQMSADAPVPGLPMSVKGSPLAAADGIVLAAYGVGTASAATIVLVETKADIPDGVRISPTLVALGPEEWVSQVEARAAIAADHTLKPATELLRLRDHAMPAGATGAVLRITARLSFDARISLARQTGLETAPAQLSLWADVADDFAIVIDADAADPGDKRSKDAARRLESTIRHAIASTADLQLIRTLGIASSLGDARFVAQGTWVRTIIAIGPRHLERVVERLRALLKP
jgi:hypothetical protein